MSFENPSYSGIHSADSKIQEHKSQSLNKDQANSFANPEDASVLLVEDARIWPGMWLMSASLVILFLVFPYIQTTLLTSLYTSDESQFAKICRELDKSFSKLYILDYEPQFKKAKIDCLYSTSSANRRIKLYKRNTGWKVESSMLLNKERSMYWPIFLD